MCVELRHSKNRALDEVTVSTTVVYRKYPKYKGDRYYKGLRTVKIFRSEVPAEILALFDKAQEKLYWDYIDKLDY